MTLHQLKYSCLSLLIICRYRVHEVLEMLEQNGDDDNVLGAEVSILPPANTGDDTDGDSGDEELLSCGNPNSLNRNQLMADAAVKL